MQKWERQRIRGITPKNKCSSLSLTALQMYFGTFECNVMYDLWLVVFCSVLLIKFIETILLMIRLGLYYSVILTAKPRLSTKMVTAFIRRVFHIRGCICFWSFFFSDQRFFSFFFFVQAMWCYSSCIHQAYYSDMNVWFLFSPFCCFSRGMN